MAQLTRAQLEALFIRGSKPPEDLYDQVWESFFNKLDDPRSGDTGESAISATDNTLGYLSGKLDFSNGFSEVIGNAGADESLVIKHLGDIYNIGLTYKTTIDASLLNADRVHSVPNKDGTFAMLSDGMYTPTTQPSIAATILTLNCNNYNSAMFEGRLSVGTLSINSDFSIAFSNTTGTKLVSLVLSLTGTRNITMPADVLVSNPSSVGSWAGSPILELTTGTDDVIELQFLRYSTNSKWLLKVSEIAV